MKTIEERIETIISEEIGNLDHPSFDLKYEIEAALKRIATEQKAIDDTELAEVKRQRDAYYDELTKLRRQKVEIIDKACEWLKKNTFLGTHPYELKKFRKAMEE